VARTHCRYRPRELLGCSPRTTYLSPGLRPPPRACPPPSTPTHHIISSPPSTPRRPAYSSALAGLMRSWKHTRCIEFPPGTHCPEELLRKLQPRSASRRLFTNAAKWCHHIASY
jgi:hypothetical protein